MRSPLSRFTKCVCDCCRLQVGYIKRAHCTEAFAPSWKFMKEEVESGKMVV